MSQENVELVYRFSEALNARDMPDDLLASDFVLTNAETIVSDGPYHGTAGAIAWATETLDLIEEERPLVIERIEAQSDDFVVAATLVQGTARLSQIPVAFRWTTAIWCADGRIARVAGFLELGEALKAVGLED
jgi:ketosteroid isomerase-like protein